MGADIVGWYGCPLQEALGQGKFLLKLKLRSYRRAAEALLRSEGRNLRSVKVRVHLLGQGMREMTLDDIIAALGDSNAVHARFQVAQSSGVTNISPILSTRALSRRCSALSSKGQMTRRPLHAGWWTRSS